MRRRRQRQGEALDMVLGLTLIFISLAGLACLPWWWELVRAMP
jgi:hypothetical protein